MNIRLKSGLASLCGLIVVPGLVNAADVTASWSASERPTSLAGGALTFAYSGDRVTAITATPTDGGTIKLSGDALPLAAGATVSITASGKLVIANAVTAAGDVAVSGCDTLTRIWNDGAAAADIAAGGDGGAALLPVDSFALMFENMNLDDWEPDVFDATLAKNQPATCWYRNYFHADYFRRETVGDEKRMTVDLVVHGSGSSVSEEWTKIARILLVQDGTSVKGRLLGFWQATRSAMQSMSLDEEFLDPSSDVAPVALAVPGNIKGYGVTQLSMRCIRPSSAVCFDGTVTVPASCKVTVGNNVRVEGRIGAVTTSGTASGVAATTPNFSVNGVMEFIGPASNSSAAESYLRGRLSGTTGTVWIRGTGAVSQWGVTTPFEDYRPGVINVNPSSSYVTPKRYAHDITNATVVFSGTAVGSSVTARMYHMKEDVAHDWGTAKFLQFQAVVGDKIICAYVRLYQLNPYTLTVQGYVSEAWSLPNVSPHGLGVDFDAVKEQATQLDCTSALTGNGLCVSELRFWSSTPRAGYLAVENDANYENDMTFWPRLLIGGTDDREQIFLLDNANALPKQGVVEVLKNGWLQLYAAGVSGKGYNGGGARLIVRKGGRLWQHASDAFGAWEWVTLDGGELRTGVNMSRNGTGSFIEILIMRDGAHVLGNPLCVGTFIRKPFFSVCGKEPSTFDSPLILQGAGEDREFQLRVADVTGDSDADFFLNGRIADYSATSTNVVFRKLGPGTVQACGDARHHGPLRIEAGAWKLGRSGVTCADPSIPTTICLCGGKLVAAQGTANTVGCLRAEGSNGRVEIEEGATLTLSMLDLAQATAPVTVIGDLTKRALRIGDGSTPVPQAELAKIRWLKDGRLKRLALDDEGWAGVGGMVIIFR